MSNTFNAGDLANLAQSILDKRNKGREFMLEDVHKLTRAAYEKHPNDSVITQVAFAIERMAERAKPGAIISQAEISGLYNNFARVASESHFREALGGLLLDAGLVANASSSDFVRQNRCDAEIEKAIADAADPKLTDTIASVFSGEAIQAYDTKVAARGAAYVGAYAFAASRRGIYESR